MTIVRRKKLPRPIAARMGDVNAIKYLVSKGADVHAKYRDGDTPIQIARYFAWQNDGITEVELIAAFIPPKFDAALVGVGLLEGGVSGIAIGRCFHVRNVLQNVQTLKNELRFNAFHNPTPPQVRRQYKTKFAELRWIFHRQIQRLMKIKLPL